MKTATVTSQVWQRAPARVAPICVTSVPLQLTYARSPHVVEDDATMPPEEKRFEIGLTNQRPGATHLTIVGIVRWPQRCKTCRHSMYVCKYP